jgi:hypothetical protein
VGIVDADALPTSEKLSPAAPSAFTAAALVARFFFEACARRNRCASVTFAIRNILIEVHFHLHEQDRAKSRHPRLRQYDQYYWPHLRKKHGSRIHRSRASF